jgi:hypothetical protein
MSQKKNKQAKPKKKKSFPWGKVLVVAIVAIAAGFYLSQRRGLKPHASGPPKIAVDQPKIDYGYVRFGTNKTFNLEVTNVGGAPLQFTEAPYIKVLAGC